MSTKTIRNGGQDKMVRIFYTTQTKGYIYYTNEVLQTPNGAWTWNEEEY